MIRKQSEKMAKLLHRWSGFMSDLGEEAEILCSHAYISMAPMGCFYSICIRVTPCWAFLKLQAEQNWTFSGNWCFQDAWLDSLRQLLVPFLEARVALLAFASLSGSGTDSTWIEPWGNERLTLLKRRGPPDLYPRTKYLHCTLQASDDLGPSSDLKSPLHMP